MNIFAPHLMRRIMLIGITYLAMTPDPLFSAYPPDFVVALDGTGDFTSIQAALDDIPVNNTQRILIFVKAGTYVEKLFIEKNCITLEGADSSTTVIRFPILRKAWRETHADDWGAATINVNASDLILRNLSVVNDYGMLYDEHDHQFSIRLMEGTRIIFDTCRFISGGGDTVSLWDAEKGQYYHQNCYFEGYVDLLCPRGWCYVTGSTFFQRKETATLWHDGNQNSNQRLVVKDSRFDGIAGFRLGRRHYDAQFILMNCEFSQNLADRSIHRVTYPDDPSRDKPNLWGDRSYFLNCVRESGNYQWFQDNFQNFEGGLQESGVTPEWTFDGGWNPEAGKSRISSSKILANVVEVTFDDVMTVKGHPMIILKSGESGSYVGGSGTKTIRFQMKSKTTSTARFSHFTGMGACLFQSKATLQPQNLVHGTP